MATINYSVVPAVDNAGGVIIGGFIYSWLGVTAADVCQAVKMPGASDKSVQCIQRSGTPTWGVEGTNNPLGADYQDLNDPQGNVLTGVTTGKVEQILENPAFIRPKSPVGAGNVDYFMMVFNSTRT